MQTPCILHVCMMDGVCCVCALYTSWMKHVLDFYQSLQCQHRCFPPDPNTETNQSGPYPHPPHTPLIQVVLGPCSSNTLHPDLDWLQQQLAGDQPPKMVVIVNPCNPTGEHTALRRLTHLNAQTMPRW